MTDPVFDVVLQIYSAWAQTFVGLGDDYLWVGLEFFKQLPLIRKEVGIARAAGSEVSFEAPAEFAKSPIYYETRRQGGFISFNIK